MCFKSHIWGKKNIGSHLGHPGHGLTCWVNSVWPSHCTGRSFDKPRPVQPLGQPGPGSTCRAVPGLKTMISNSENITIARAHEISILPSCIFFSSRWVRQTISIMHLWVRETISMRPFPWDHFHHAFMSLTSCIYESFMSSWDHFQHAFMSPSVHETIAICTLVHETIAIMHFSSRRGHEMSSSNQHAFFPRDGVVRSGL
jgi:hypothetical protein